MLPDQVSNPGPLTYKPGALPIALCGKLSKQKVGYNDLPGVTAGCSH